VGSIDEDGRSRRDLRALPPTWEVDRPSRYDLHTRLDSVKLILSGLHSKKRRLVDVVRTACRCFAAHWTRLRLRPTTLYTEYRRSGRSVLWQCSCFLRIYYHIAFISGSLMSLSASTLSAMSHPVSPISLTQQPVSYCLVTTCACELCAGRCLKCRLQPLAILRSG
jgi:hypothetical protein